MRFQVGPEFCKNNERNSGPLRLLPVNRLNGAVIDCNARANIEQGEQNCSIILGSWTYDGYILDLQLFDKKVGRK